jgi:AcrR family transcriptional regulator
MSAVPLSTKEQIVQAAERLFAEHGVDGVSLRQIGAAAGNANNSAVQYHFGSKEQLIRAIFEYRQPRIRERRALLIAEHRPADLRTWVGCQVRAVLEQSELAGSHYMGFIAMLHQHGRRDAFAQLRAEARAETRAYHEAIGAFLGHIPEPLRAQRISQAMALIVQVAANREQARAADILPFALELNNLLDGVVGFLEAPVSPASLAALEDLDPADIQWPTFV